MSSNNKIKNMILGPEFKNIILKADTPAKAKSLMMKIRHEINETKADYNRALYLQNESSRKQGYNECRDDFKRILGIGDDNETF